MGIQKTKILVVDDIEKNLLYVEGILEELDIEVVTATSGTKAIELVQENEFALVILDVQMPGIDGFETLEKIRKTRDNEQIPVIFISGVYTDETYVVKGLESGAVDFMTKPVNKSILLAKARVYVELYRQRKDLYELIGKLKQTNKKLEESENRFKKISMVAVDAIIVINKDGKITYWNPSAEKIFGYTKHETRYITFQSLFPPKKYKNGLPENLKKFIESDRVNIIDRTIELTAIKKNKLEFPIELTISSFQIENNWHAVSVIRDITRRQRIEKELLRAKEAKEANKVMSEFIDNLNHELRTPLNAIIGISKSMIKYENKGLCEKHIEALEHIHESGKRLNTLIERLFEFRRKQEIKIAEFLLDDFINDIETFVNNSLNDKPVKVQFEKVEPLPKVLNSDRIKIYQILTSIIENALKFTEKGSINIKYSNLDDRICFEIKDTGIGIEEEQIKNIFKKFIQVDGTTSRKFGGAGLGLALASKLTKQLNGEIDVKSKLNEGTIFTVILPVDLSDYLHSTQ
ncbi:MAG: response regulator [Bacteroidales bacterium]|nr:MAG: response regulator [Bacteroidales bacterium]